MSYNFCTLFDKNYIFRGLALHASLLRHCPDFNLWILCMDDVVYGLLNKMNLSRSTLIRLSEVEDGSVLVAKANRGVGEYCWTLSSVLSAYMLKSHPTLDYIAYIDSDTYFYSNPAPIFEEMGDDSILIIKHNYTPDLEYLEKRSGIYNVALVIFKNDERALQCVNWWREQCLKWCYNRLENGKFGDQMYLDDWPARFNGVHVLNHKGGDVAPWNINRYHLGLENNGVRMDNDNLIFYHFHSLKIFSLTNFQPYSFFYKISSTVFNHIYQPYLGDLRTAINMVKSVDRNYEFGFDRRPSRTEIFKQYVKRYFHYLLKI